MVSNNKNKRFFSTLSLSILTSAVLYADISGVVFQDLPVNGTALNSYGVKDSNEFGVGGITVTAYPDNISTTTDANGAWSLATTSDSRIEFSNIPSYLKESVEGGAKNASVQFVVDGATTNFALHDVNDYSNVAQPNYTTNILSGGSNIDSTIPSLVTNQYTDSGLNAEHQTYGGDQGTGPVPVTDAEAKDIGAVWGKGFQSSKQRMFIASVLWRHIGFANGSPSQIFVADYSTSPATILGNIDLQGRSGIDLGSVNRDSGSDYTLADNPSSPSIDLDAYAKIAKVSYGDLDFDNNTETIWTVNLNQKALISIDASGDYASLASATVNQYLIEGLNGVPTCTGGELRPWGLGIHNGKGYLGSICDASTSQNTNDLKAYVSTFDLNNPSAGLTTVFSMDMAYDRSGDDGYSENPNFFPWTDSVQDTTTNWDGYNQPILSDIDFDEKGNLYLGFIDRWGMQIGKDNYTAESGSTDATEDAYGQGEILKVCNSNGLYELEGTGSCPTGTSSDGDFFDDKGGDNNANPSGGAMAILKGSNQMILAVNDPHPSGDTGRDYWTTNGVQTFNTTTGANENWYAHINSGSIEYTGKASGMGDIELLTAPAPIEIGDRVWEDTNADGVQDANESGIADITVELVCSGAVVSTATTDTDGNYIFSNNPNGTSSTSHKYNVTSLVAGSDNCLVRIPNIQGDSKQISLGDNILTPANIGEGANSNINDSDGILNGDNAEINVTGVEIPLNGANNHSFDFGFSLPQKAKLGDFVWNDINKNGIQDEGESGVANVTAKVFKDCVGSELATTQTNPTGFYLFEDLEEGSYCVEFSDLPTDYLVSPSNQNGDDENDSDVDASTMRTSSVTLEAGDNNLSLDMGIYYGKASIGDMVWIDANRDGIQNGRESGVEGVLAVLYEGDCSTKIKDVETNAQGKYLFDQLDAGEYCIGFKNIPSGYAITEKNATGSTADNNSDVDPSTSKAVKTTLDEGENDMSWDMGIYQLASIGDKVWHDKNRDGLQAETEEGVDGVGVTLLKDCTTVVANTTTDGNGNYLFSNIEPANYCLEFSDLPEGYLVTTKDVGENNAIDSDVDSDTMQTVSVTVESGSADLSWDMGIYQLATIGDKVWYDNNGDGIQDRNETGVEGVKVELLKDCNTTISNKVTDSNGNYLFRDLEPASYCLKFSNIPTDYYITGADRIADDQDSDVNPTTGLTTPTELLSGEDDRTWDMGISQFASIGNRVWLDSNANGIQDVNESGVSNVTVKLIENCGGRGETIVDNMETDGTGHYLFTGVSPSNYCLEFSDLPVGAEISSADQGDDENDSDVNSVTMRTSSTELNPGAVDERWDMGIYFPASVGDKVWHDLNANGLQDLNESGVADVTVTLYDGTCTTVATDKDGVDISTVVTSATGAYLFDNLVPANYCIGFSDLPEGFVVTSRDVNLSMDANDSDVNASTGTTAVLELRSNEQDMSWDLGIYQPATLGDLVWIDANKNGLQDDGNESGVEGVTVVLYDMNCSQEVNRTTTDSNGTYLFSNLVPNEYCVQFSDLPTGYGITTQTVVMEENNDSDVNPSTGATPNTMLTSGEDDRSWDMGIYKRPVSTVITPFIPVSTATPSPTPAPAKACFGDRVWEDSNRDGIQNADEAGVKDIAVTLYQADCNTEINRTITDANGNYLFSDLEPAEYCVGFSALPTDYTVTVKDRGASDLEDSDVNPETQKTDSFVLVGGEACDVSIDMGIYKETPMQELRIYDDLVSANTEGPVTTIALLDNDAVGEGATVAFVNVEEGEIIWKDGTAVAGTNLSTSDELYVEGEGTWRVESDGTVTFTADDGFDGTPTPVYYIVKDEEGNQSNVAQLSIVTDCVCDPYEVKAQDSIASLSLMGMTLMLFLLSGMALLFIREELAIEVK